MEKMVRNIGDRPGETMVDRTSVAHPVSRVLVVMGMVCPDCEGVIIHGLGAMNGVLNVTSKWEKNRVMVTYDLHKTCLGALETTLREIGYPPDNGFFARKKRDWLHFTEQNEVDNMKHVGHCCSKTPVSG